MIGDVIFNRHRQYVIRDRQRIILMYLMSIIINIK